jgi:hypothetical protein
MVGGRMELSKKITESVTQCVIYAIHNHRNFRQRLTYTKAIIYLLKFLNENAASGASRTILNHVSIQPFDLNDLLCIQILLELLQILFQLFSIISPVDVIKKRIASSNGSSTESTSGVTSKCISPSSCPRGMISRRAPGSCPRLQ